VDVVELSDIGNWVVSGGATPSPVRLRLPRGLRLRPTPHRRRPEPWAAFDALVAALKESRGVLVTLAVALPAGSLTHELVGRCDAALKLAEVP
jgi:hypothetical protein